MTVVLATLALIVPHSEAKTTVVHKHHHRCDHVCGSLRYMKRTVRPYDWKLERMAGCESSHRWHINTGNGFYGGLQFTLSTWWSMRGRGYPHQHSELEQKYRAVKLIRRAGYSPWPVCGYV
jgi:hypothetical protein